MSDIYTSDAFESVEITESEIGTLKNVKLLGLRSKNRRSYDTPGVRATAVKLLTGAPIFLNHPADAKATRSYADSFGVVESVEYRAGHGYYGAIKYNPDHPMAKKFAWDVKHVPRTFGMSINSRAKFGGKNDQGDTIVESLEEIRSVDVVTRPATVSGIFEEEEVMTKENKDAGDSVEAEKLRSELKQALEQIETFKREAEQQKLRAEVTEAFTTLMKDFPITDEIRKDVVECACQMAAEPRDKFKSVLSKMGPLFKVVDDATLDADGTGAEESDESGSGEGKNVTEGKQAKVAPKVGSGGKKVSYNLLESLGLNK